jgi:hypothetical protein
VESTMKKSQVKTEMSLNPAVVIAAACVAAVEL